MLRIWIEPYFYFRSEQNKNQLFKIELCFFFLYFIRLLVSDDAAYDSY